VRRSRNQISYHGVAPSRNPPFPPPLPKGGWGGFLEVGFQNGSSLQNLKSLDVSSTESQNNNALCSLNPLSSFNPHSAISNPKSVYPSFFIFLIILGMKREKINSPTEKKTLKEISCLQSPAIQTSLIVPMKKVKIKVPTRMPNPVPTK